MTKNSKNKLTDQINKRLADVLTRICKNPCLFVSESDIHLLVARELMKIPRFNPEKRLHSTNCTIGINQFGVVSKTKYKTMLIHKEYGHKNFPNARSDLVILSKKSVNQINDPISLKEGKTWLQPEYIFEFGTEKAASTKTTFEKHLENDLFKLAEAKECGYLIHIHRNYQRSVGVRKTKNIEKYESYLEGYSKKYFDFAIHPNFDFEKIKIIIIIIDIGGSGRNIWSKYRILKDPYCKNNHLSYNKIEINTIYNSISDLLNIKP